MTRYACKFSFSFYIFSHLVFDIFFKATLMASSNQETSWIMDCNWTNKWVYFFYLDVACNIAVICQLSAPWVLLIRNSKNSEWYFDQIWRMVYIVQLFWPVEWDLLKLLPHLIQKWHRSHAAHFQERFWFAISEIRVSMTEYKICYSLWNSSFHELDH